MFVDPKSSESALPHFSNGGRDDQQQAAYIGAFQKHWDHQHIDFEATNNPSSSVFNGRMVDFQKSQLWAWDARPYPSFPHLTDQWSDASNWTTGHWLNGRLGSVRLSDLIAELMLENNLLNFDASHVYGSTEGYIIADKTTARNAIEVLLALYRISVFEDGGVLIFRSTGLDEATQLEPSEIVETPGSPRLSFHREQETDLPVSVHFSHVDPNNEYQEADTDIQRVNRLGLHQQNMSAPLVMAKEQTLPLLQAWLQARWISRDSVAFGLSNAYARLTVGDEVVFDTDSNGQRWQITQIDSGENLAIEARSVERLVPGRPRAESRSHLTEMPNYSSAPHVVFLDLPILQTGTSTDSNHVAVTAKPWTGEQAIFNSPTKDGYVFRQSITNSAFSGRLIEPLAADLASGRWSRASTLKVSLYNGTLSSQSNIGVLTGANALCVRSTSGAWEVLQFRNAELIDNDTWLMTDLIRGQAGTEREASLGAETGADVVVLNQAVYPIENALAQRGLELNWIIGPTGKSLNGPGFTQKTCSLGYRGALPYSPAHLRATMMSSGDINLSWIRRDRLNADDWASVEIPMSEQEEMYLVQLTAENGSMLSKTVQTPEITITAGEIETEFGPNPTPSNISVAQVSALVGAGPSANLILPTQ